MSATRAKNKNGLWRFNSGFFFIEEKDTDLGMGDVIDEDEDDDDFIKEDL